MVVCCRVVIVVSLGCCVVALLLLLLLLLFRQFVCRARVSLLRCVIVMVCHRRVVVRCFVFVDFVLGCCVLLC